MSRCPHVPPSLAGAIFVLCHALASCSGAQPDPPDTGRGGEPGDAGPDGAAPDVAPCPSDLPERESCSTDTPSYQLAVAPIIEQRCATCHYPDNPRSRYVFSNHDDVSADRRTVLTRIYGCVMPPADAPQLTSEERRTLLTWLVCGAPDN